ncbi:hypothetical protein CL617_05750 [archaeon]|nr:hypothetical protein [archaeon]|tara:strand:+ start:2097 stop:2537 length:441 start_codon:yes stop_codon:yes gene_type:complete
MDIIIRKDDDKRDETPKKGRGSVIDILRKMKGEESRKAVKLESFGDMEDFDRKKELYKDIPVKEKSFQKDPLEIEILDIMNELDKLSGRMKRGEDYLNLYFDLKRMEDKFLETAVELEKGDTEISEAVLKRINTKKKIIENKKFKI